MYYRIRKKSLIIQLFLWIFGNCFGDDDNHHDSFVIPLIDPKDCLNSQCFNPHTGTCKSPGNCLNELKNETFGKWSNCFLTCPSNGDNCKTINNNNEEIDDLFSIIDESQNKKSSFCLSTNNDNCLPAVMTQFQRYCLDKNNSSNWQESKTNYLIEFNNQTIDSYYLRKELKFAMIWCEEGNYIACEHLSNICTLTLKMNSFPCKLFLSKNPPTNLFHATTDAKEALERRFIPSKFTLLEKDSQNNKLNFVLGKYSLRGNFESYSDWISPCSFFKNLRFGVNGEKICWTSAKDLIDLKTIFYVPYLSFTTDDNKNKYIYPIPVLLKTNDTDLKNTSKWILMNKFFMIDIVTGSNVQMTHENLTISKAPVPEIIRYVKSLIIEVKSQERKQRGKIFPPLIILEFGELTQSDIEKNIDISIEYKIVFKLTEAASNLWIKVAGGIAAGLALLYAIFFNVSYYRRNANDISIIKSISYFLIYYFGAIGTDLLIITFTVCISAFIFYKGQTVLHILLPTVKTEKIIKIFTIIAFGGKTIEIISLIYQLRNINIFLIDWETPRKMISAVSYDSPHTSLRKSYNQRFPRETLSGRQTPSQVIAARRNRTPSKSSQASTPSRQSVSRNLDALDQFTPNYIDANFSLDDQDISQNSLVSMWRTYFIANEWLKIKTKRKVNLLVHILGTLFFLEIVGFKNWSLATPSLKMKSQKNDFVGESFTLKFAIGAFTYSILYFLQWFITILYTKYYKNRLHGFVDLCSVANISIFILVQEYYGYYIHGRSVHGFADTDLLTVINDLKREENNLCAHRGLIPGTTDQTFIVCLSKSFKTFYDSVAMKDPNERKFWRKHLTGNTNWEERWKQHLTIKKFLCQFLDHCFKNVDYTVKERHWLEKLFDTEFMEANREKSIFYIDKNYSFDRAIFYGNEWSFATFEASVFALMLAIGGNYILSAVMTIFLSLIVEFFAKFDMKRNLANRTLIDERFLMS